jgi:hypothetical protein
MSGRRPVKMLVGLCCIVFDRELAVALISSVFLFTGVGIRAVLVLVV